MLGSWPMPYGVKDDRRRSYCAGEDERLLGGTNRIRRRLPPLPADGPTTSCGKDQRFLDSTDLKNALTSSMTSLAADCNINIFSEASYSGRSTRNKMTGEGEILRDRDSIKGEEKAWTAEGFLKGKVDECSMRFIRNTHSGDNDIQDFKRSESLGQIIGNIGVEFAEGETLRYNCRSGTIERVDTEDEEDNAETHHHLTVRSRDVMTGELGTKEVNHTKFNGVTKYAARTTSPIRDILGFPELTGGEASLNGTFAASHSALLNEFDTSVQNRAISQTRKNSSPTRYPNFVPNHVNGCDSSQAHHLTSQRGSVSSDVKDMTSSSKHDCSQFTEIDQNRIYRTHPSLCTLLQHFDLVRVIISDPNNYFLSHVQLRLVNITTCGCSQRLYDNDCAEKSFSDHALPNFQRRTNSERSINHDGHRTTTVSEGFENLKMHDQNIQDGMHLDRNKHNTDKIWRQRFHLTTLTGKGDINNQARCEKDDAVKASIPNGDVNGSSSHNDVKFTNGRIYDRETNIFRPSERSAFSFVKTRSSKHQEESDNGGQINFTGKPTFNDGSSSVNGTNPIESSDDVFDHLSASSFNDIALVTVTSLDKLRGTGWSDGDKECECEGRLLKDDHIIEVNGNNVIDSSVSDTVALLTRCDNVKHLVVARPRPNNKSVTSRRYDIKIMPNKEINNSEIKQSVTDDDDHIGSKANCDVVTRCDDATRKGHNWNVTTTINDNTVIIRENHVGRGISSSSSNSSDIYDETIYDSEYGWQRVSAV